MEASGLTDERRVFLSTLPAGRCERRLALAAVLASAAVFLAAAPFAKLPLAQIGAFIPIYESALVINDLITAVLLFGQFGILRSRALLVLACGYLLTAFMAVAHALTFPGLFSPTGLLGAGPQSTAWLYMFWHGGFPLFVIAYALLKGGAHDASGTSGRAHEPTAMAVGSSVAVLFLAVCSLALLATAGQDALPAIMQGNHYTPAMIVVVSSVWVLSLLALAVLWRRRPHSLLDLWLMVVMCAWIFDIALSAVLNAGRFDLGFYAGRIYGLLAASFVLIVLLLENSVLYSRLVEAHESERRKASELLAVNKELDAFSYSVAHDLRSPLTAISAAGEALGSPTLSEQERAELAAVILEEAKRLSRLVDNLLDLSRLEAGAAEPRREWTSVEELIRAALQELAPGPDEFSLSIDRDLPLVLLDPAQMERAFVNVLENARRHSGGHPVSVRARAVRSLARVPVTIPAGESARDAPSSGDRVIVRIVDRGPGIPPAQLERVFEPFYRAGTSAGGHRGSGLGLAIARGFTETSGGSLHVESLPGQGATFIFEFPLGQPGH